MFILGANLDSGAVMAAGGLLLFPGIVIFPVSAHFALVQSDYGLVPARGTKIEIELDEQQFAGGGAYLFSAVLDRFLAGYASMNSFSQLEVRTNLRKESRS